MEYDEPIKCDSPGCGEAGRFITAEQAAPPERKSRCRCSEFQDPTKCPVHGLALEPEPQEREWSDAGFPPWQNAALIEGRWRRLTDAEVVRIKADIDALAQRPTEEPTP